MHVLQMLCFGKISGKGDLVVIWQQPLSGDRYFTREIFMANYATN